MMEPYDLPPELDKALERADKQNDRAVAAAGFGASDHALELTRGAMGGLTEYLRLQMFDETQPINSNLEHAMTVLRELDPEVLCFAGLSALWNSIALQDTYVSMIIAIGRGIANELFAAGITRDDPKLAKHIEQTARKRHSRVKGRLQTARSLARRRGFRVRRWTNDRLAIVGHWFFDCAKQALPDLFVVEQRRDSKGRHAVYTVTVNPSALERAENIIGALVMAHPVYQPTTDTPLPWTSWTSQHPDPRVPFDATLLRSFHKDVKAATSASIKTGVMSPVLNAVNTLQAVPWRINTRVLAVMQHMIEHKIECASLPAFTEAQYPPKLSKKEERWAQLDEKKVLARRLRVAEVKQENRTNVCERINLAKDMAIAERFRDAPRFYTPMSCDWRGRVYALPHFNFQREDRVRALFQFADGAPLGTDGLKWLKVHLANVGDFDKISKRPLQERVQWVDTHRDEIREVAQFPFEATWWMQADSPFLFLAACIEFANAVQSIARGVEFVTHLPVSFDGSCSGLQHLSAMTRDERTASLVNLLPSEEPSDIYSVVADDVVARLKADGSRMARRFLRYGVDRKVTKRNVMTYSYSSPRRGMAGQQQVDLMDVLTREVIRGKRETHPFAPHHKGSMELPGKAAYFIASHVYDAIEATISRPAQAMKFLQACARALAHEGKPLRWTTPTGLPWINRYHEPVSTTLQLYCHDRSIKRIRVATGSQPEIDKFRAASAVSPNVVHALDAAHLMLCVNACQVAGIHAVATVHDSFGCLAPQAVEFNKIIRAEFVRMYQQHDVLAEIRENALADLTQHNRHRIPALPEYGTLDLTEIHNAEFAFA